MTNERRILLGLFAIAFGVRILYAALVGTDPSINPHPVTSEMRYALEISSGFDWITQPYSPQAPGYPLLLGMLFLLTGKHAWTAIVLQAVLGGFLVLIAYRLGKLVGSVGVGLISAVWLALYVHHVHFSSLLVRDAFSGFLLAALVLVLALPFKRMRYSLLGGGLYALLVHTDPQYILLFPLIAAYILVFTARYLVINLQYLFLFTSFALILSLPWSARNYVVYKQFVPVSLEAVRYVSPVKEKLPAKIRQVARGSRAPVSRGRLERMKANAIEFWRVVKRGEAEGAQGAGAGGWSLRHNPISIASYGLLLPFFIFGVAAAFIRREKVTVLLASVTLYYFLMRLFLGGSERIRLQVEPFIIILAFSSLFALSGRLRAQEDQRAS